jgi:hypothetical protein
MATVHNEKIDDIKTFSDTTHKQCEIQMREDSQDPPPAYESLYGTAPDLRTRRTPRSKKWEEKMAMECDKALKERATRQDEATKQAKRVRVVSSQKLTRLTTHVAETFEESAYLCD